MGIDSSGFHPEDQTIIIPKLLVSLDLLDSFDGLIWLQSGKQVGTQFQQHQTTVSRNQKKCARTFGLALKKEHGSWTVEGNTELLELEREVHQAARLLEKAPLRLEANGWMDGLLCSPSPEGCVTGACKPLGVTRCLNLLHSCIVDAWLCPLPDVPQHETDLSIHALCTLPMSLMVAPSHPLLQQRSVTLEEARRYPWKRIRRGAYPATEKQLRALNLWPPERRNKKIDSATWEAINDWELTVHLGSVLTSNGCTSGMVPLPLALGVETGLALIIKQKHASQKPIQNLIASLRQRLMEQQTQHPEIQLLS